MKNAGTILLVDDDSDLRTLFSTFLEQEGYEILAAATGRQAIDLALTHRPHLVLLDVGLPDISGVEVCRQIKNNPEMLDVFVAFCSGEATSDEQKVGGLQIGADEYIVKPIGHQELLARVKTLINLRNTAAALRASEEHHRRLIEILPDAVCLIHQNGCIITANSRAVWMLGYSNETELLNKTIFEFTPSNDRERIKDEFMNAFKTGSLRNAEYFLLSRNGTPFSVELSATVALGIGTKPVGLLCVIRDTTERKQAQMALHASEERFRQLANHIQEVFWISNTDKSEIIYVSPAYEKIWGRTCEALYQSPKSWLEAIHPADRDRVCESSLTKQVSGEYDETYCIIRPDGSIRWIHDRAFPVQNSAGDVYRIVGIADDITKRTEAWNSLGESEARKRAIMQASLDGIITFDHQGRIIEVNSAAEKIFGRSQVRLIGENVMSVIPASFKSWFKSGLSNHFSGEKGPVKGSRIEIPAVRSDGNSFTAEFTITQIRLPGDPTFTLYIRDITQRKRAEAELRSLPQRIIKAQEGERLRIAQELHDGINQLIASVKMRLSKVESSSPELKPAAREILTRCDRLLVKVLEENRRIAHNLRPAELDNLGLVAACNHFCSEVQSRSHLRFLGQLRSPAKRLPENIELHLFRIVQEAINNIEKHAQAKSIKLQIRQRKGFVILTIQDDGRGFEAKNLKPSGNTRRGLGLTHMRERTLSLGGSCEIESIPGQGTTITVSVPFTVA